MFRSKTAISSTTSASLINFMTNDHKCKIHYITFEIGFYRLLSGHILMKIYILLTNGINDVTYSHKSVMCVVITFFIT